MHALHAVHISGKANYREFLLRVRTEYSGQLHDIYIKVENNIIFNHGILVNVFICNDSNDSTLGRRRVCSVVGLEPYQK